MKNYKKIVDTLLIGIIAIVNLVFPNLLFHVFFAIILVILLGSISAVLYLLETQDKKKDKNKIKTYQLERMVELK